MGRWKQWYIEVSGLNLKGRRWKLSRMKQSLTYEVYVIPSIHLVFWTLWPSIREMIPKSLRLHSVWSWAHTLGQVCNTLFRKISRSCFWHKKLILAILAILAILPNFLENFRILFSGKLYLGPALVCSMKIHVTFFKPSFFIIWTIVQSTCLDM